MHHEFFGGVAFYGVKYYIYQYDMIVVYYEPSVRITAGLEEEKVRTVLLFAQGKVKGIVY